MPPSCPQLRFCSIERSHIARLIEIADETGLSHWSADSYLAEMSDPKSIMFRLVTEENETIGFVVGRVVPGGQLEVKVEAELYNIAVTSVFEGRGYGQALLAEFLTRADARRARSVWLEVRESNIRAIEFYIRNGFVRVQTRPNFYDNPREAALLMRLDLPLEKS